MAPALVCHRLPHPCCAVRRRLTRRRRRARCGRGVLNAPGRGRAQSAGRTREERQRRQYVEGRMEALAQQISHLRLELKRHS